MPDTSSLVIVSRDPLILVVPLFLAPASCVRLRQLCMESEKEAVTKLRPSDDWTDNDKRLVDAVDAAIAELTGQPPPEGEDLLLPLLTHAAPMRDSPVKRPLRVGLHVDNNGACVRRYTAAIIYLSNPVGGQTDFPLAAPGCPASPRLPVQWGPAASEEVLAAGRGLLEHGVLHTKGAREPPQDALASCLLSAAEAGSGVAAEAREGSLVLFWCRRADGEMCPRSWHAGVDVAAGGPSKLILRKFINMPWAVWDQGIEGPDGVAAFVHRTRAPYMSTAAGRDVA